MNRLDKYRQTVKQLRQQVRQFDRALAKAVCECADWRARYEQRGAGTVRIDGVLYACTPELQHAYLHGKLLLNGAHVRRELLKFAARINVDVSDFAPDQE